MESHQQTKWAQFTSLIIVFFFWGFVAASNDILIPIFKKWFVLSQVQSQLVASAFYSAYFVGSLIFFLISLKSDILQKFGYKKTLAFGLVLSAIGAFLFVPAAATASFGFFLAGLFTVGLGLSVQQIVANPLAIRMGDPSTGAHRLTLAGGINSLGTTLGPILVGMALFGFGDKKPAPKMDSKQTLITQFEELRKELTQNAADLNADPAVDANQANATTKIINRHVEAIDQELAELNATTDETFDRFENDLKDIRTGKQNGADGITGTSNIHYPEKFVQKQLALVKTPFIVLGVAFILVALFMAFSNIEDPAKTEEKKLEAGDKRFRIGDYPQLYLGMLAIFVYVGVEVSIASNLPALLHTREFGGILESGVAPFISLYWGSLMIGRWNGGINVFKTSITVNTLLKFLVPAIAFAIIIVANTLSGKDISDFYIYGLWILGFILISFLGGRQAGKTLMIFGLAGILMMLIGLFLPDPNLAKYFFISGGLFCSIMWPAIFDLAIAGLGRNTGKASSFLIMMILGGAVIPLIQGAICDLDKTHPRGIMGISYTHFSYIIPVIGFAYLAFYGFIAPKIIRKQGVDLGESSGAH